MAIDAKRARLIFQRLEREVTKLSKKPATASVHKFRTNSRRVEALLGEFALKQNRNQEKLLRLLARLRKKAGRVRDLDVQITAMRGLKNPQANGHKSQFMDALVQERRDREKKLAHAFDRGTAMEMRKRIKRVARELNIPDAVDPAALALQRLAELARDNAPLTEKTLHQYRILGKRARYIAELAEGNAEAERVVDSLKNMQNVLGDWHDWLKLAQKAEEILGNVRESSLVAMLHNVARAKFRQSLDVVAELRSNLASKPPETTELRKPTSRETRAARAVA